MAAEAHGPPTLDGYRHLRRLGRGGFADVFLYEQQLPRREVAVKVLFADADAAVFARFTDEANIVAQLSSHPAIVPIYQAGVSDDGRPFLVLEYCPGPNLAARSAAAPLPVPEALKIGIQIAGAVETAHRAGILHRDIKPHNILTSAYGRAKLTDFGIAQTLAAARPDHETGLSVPWAPPELFEAGQPSVASDVYSLSATIYTLIAGRSPFEIPGGDNDHVAVMMRIARSAVPVIDREDVPPQLFAVLEQGLAKDAEDRHPSALALARALHQVESALLLTPTAIDVFDAGVAPAPEVASDELTRIKPIAVIRPNAPEPLVAPNPADQAATPPAAEADRRPARSRGLSIGVLVGAVVAVLVAFAAAVAFVLGEDEPQLAGPPGDQSPGPVVGSRPQTPQDLEGVRHPDGTVVFTWTNPAPQEGDSYLWRFDEQGLGSRPVHVDEPRAEFEVPAGRQGCIVVMTVRGGQTSDPTPHACPRSAS